jgi:uncharacterized protein (DUF433 family)
VNYSANINDYVDSNPKKMGGKVCLKGTRFPVAQLIAELEDMTAGEIAIDFDLEPEIVFGFLNALSLELDEVPLNINNCKVG